MKEPAIQVGKEKQLEFCTSFNGTCQPVTSVLPWQEKMPFRMFGGHKCGITFPSVLLPVMQTGPQVRCYCP